MKFVPYILVFVMLCTLAAAEIRIEMPNEVPAGEQFKLRLVMDDAKISGLTKSITMENSYGSFYFKRVGGNQYKDFTYNGESEFVFDAVVLGGFSSDTSNHYFEISFLLKSDSGVFATVSRNISITPVSFYVSTPSVPGEIVKNDWKQPDVESMLFTFYNKDSKADLGSYYGTFSRDVCIEPPCIGSAKLEGLTNAKEYTGQVNIQGEACDYYAYATPLRQESDGRTRLNVKFRYILQKGIMRYNGQIEKSFTTSDVDGAASSTIREMSGIAQTVKYVAGQAVGGAHTSNFVSSLKTEAPTSSVIVYGTVSDSLDNPMPYMQVDIDTADKKTFTGLTDGNGDYSITLTGISDKGEVPIKVYAIWKYNRSNKNYFTIYTLNNNNRYKRVYAAKEFKIVDGKNLEVHFKLGAGSGADYSSNLPTLDDIKSYATMYYHFHEAVEFALVKLKANIDYKLPVSVLVGNTEGNTWYENANQRIRIHSGDYNLGSTNRPMNREWHEFAHHILFAQYGGNLPAGRNVQGTVPHDGFMNPNTGDSFTEGFAEFIAMAIAQDVGKPNPSQYANYGDMEDNMKPWDWLGHGEEFAVAGLLWDLIDKNNEPGDGLTLSVEDVWNILKDKRNDFSEFYKELKNRYPIKSKEIDALFAAHGFYVNPTVGNKKYDCFEGYRDANKNGQYDAGEFYVDYGCQNSTAQIVYSPSMIVGRAANYERPLRTSAAMLPGAFLGVKNKEVRLYKITVAPKQGSPYSFDSDLRGGLIYVSPPTSDATITITADSKDYSTESPYVITSSELMKKIYSSKGTFDTHDFKLKATGTKLDPEFILPSGEPSFGTDAGMDNPSKVILEDDKSDNRMGKSDGGGGSTVLIVVIVMVALIIGGFIFKKKKKGKKR